MSQTVDNRVVELQFDNKQFEQGTKESLNSIQKLKDALKFEDAGKNLKGLSDVTKNFDLNGIGNAVEQVGEKFSTMRMVGLMALSNIVDGAMEAGKKILSALTAPLNQIKTGGWNRAMNIEQAKFQLKGLEIAWEDIAEDIDYAVKGTAYGLDAAAKAASQLTASGVEFGKAFGDAGNSPMAKALRGISGVAAMTNSSYEDISQVFTRVAGQGRVMATDLNSLAARGLNAASVLAKKFNVSEEELRKMVSKGKVDFKTFSEAMDDAFGEHAKAANDTFTGALSNIKAALSRIGQNFATPIIQNAIPVFNKLRLIVDAINAGIKNSGLYTAFEKVANVVQKILVGNLSKVEDFFKNDTKFIKNIVDSLRIGFTNVLRIFIAIKNAWSKVFTGSASKNLKSITDGFLKLSKVLTPTEGAVKGIEKIFTALFTILKKVGTVIGSVAKTIGPPLITAFSRVINIGLILIGVVADIITAILNLANRSKILQTIFGAISLAISKVINIFTNFKNKLSDSSSGIGKFTTILSNGFRLVASIVAGVLAVAINGIIILFNKLRSIDFSSFLNGLINIKNFVVDLLTYVRQLPIINTILQAVSNGFLILIGSIIKIGSAFGNLISGIIHGRITFNDFLSSIKNWISSFAGLKDKISNFLKTNTLIVKFTEVLNKFSKSFGNFGKTVFEKIKSLDAARVILFAFASGITLMVFRVQGAIKSFSNLLNTGSNAISTFIKSIAPKKTSFFTTFAGNLLKIAAAIAVVAMSIKMVANIPADNLEKATKSLLMLAGGAAALALVATILGSILKVGKDGFSAFSANMLMFSAGVGILSASLLMLDNIKMKDIWQKVGIIGAIAAGLTAVSIVMAKFAPKLATGSIFMLSFAVSVGILVKSLERLTEYDLSGLEGYWRELLAIFVGLAALAFSVSKIGIGPVLSLVAFALGLKVAFKALSDAGTSLETIVQNLSEVLSGIIIAVKEIFDRFVKGIDNIFYKLNEFADNIEQRINEFAYGINETFGKFIEKINSLELLPENIRKIIFYVTLVAGAVLALRLVFRSFKALSDLGKGLADIGKSFLMISAGIVALIYVSKYISKWIDESPNMKTAIGMIATLMAFVSAMILASNKANPAALKQVKGMFTSLTTVLLAMTAFIAVAGKLTPSEWTRATISLEAALITIGVFGVIIAKINAASQESAKTGILSFLGIIAMFGVFLGSIAVIMANLRTEEDYINLAVALGSIMFVIYGITKILDSIANIKVGTNWKPILASFGGLLIVMMAIAGVALLLKDQVWNDIAANVGVVLGALVLITALAMGIDALIRNKAFNATKTAKANLIQLAAIVGVIIIVMYAIAVLAALIKDLNPLTMLAQLSVISLVMLELAVVVAGMALITKIAKPTSILIATAALAVMTACFAAIAAMAVVLKDIPAGDIIGKLSLVSVILVELGIIVGLMGLAAEWMALGIIGVACLISMTALFMQIGSMAVVLKDIPAGDIIEKLSSVSLILVELGLIVAFLGVLSPACALGLAGVRGIIAICQAMLILSDVLNSLKSMSADSIEATLKKLTNCLWEIVGIGAVAKVVSAGLIVLANAVEKIGIACINAGTGITMLSSGMQMLSGLKDQLPEIGSALKSFFETLNSDISTQLVEIGGTVQTQIFILTIGVSIALQQGLMSAAGVAYKGANAIGFNIVNGFQAGTGSTNSSGGIFSKFMKNAKSELVNTGEVVNSTRKAWFNVGKATEIGFRDGAQWHSPPEWETNFFTDVAHAVTSSEGDLTGVFERHFFKAGKSAETGWKDGVSDLMPEINDTVDEIKDALGTDFSFDGNFDYSSLMNQLYNMEDDVTDEVKRIEYLLSLIGDPHIDRHYYDDLKKKIELNEKYANTYYDLAKAAQANASGTAVYNNRLYTYSELRAEANIRTHKANEYSKELAEIDGKLAEKEKELAKGAEDAAGGLNNFGDAATGAGKSAKQASDDLQQFQESLRSTLEGQMDVFSEFKQSEKHTKEELFKNIQSQINGMASWAVNMQKLGEKGLDQGLYQKLGEMGVQGQGYMEAFLSMTDEEIQKYNELWATSLVLPDASSKMVAASAQNIGENIVLGLRNGVLNNEDKALTTIGEFGDEAINTAKDHTGVQSPSKYMIEIGRFLMEGLRLGMLNNQGNVFSRITFICQHIVALASNGLQAGKFSEFGGNIISGLISGIESQEEALWTKIDKLCSEIEEKIHNSTLKFGSPSKTMMKYGGWIDEGLAIGIDKNTGIIYSSIDDLSNNVLNSMKLTVANIAAQVNDSFEDPVITPILDLSNVRSGVNDLNSIFNTNQAAIRAGSFTNNQNGQSNGTGNMIFNQYNTSPKALSRIEIYRDTRNLFAQAKGALS